MTSPTSQPNDGVREEVIDILISYGVDVPKYSPYEAADQIMQLIARETEAARIASIDEYLTHCHVLMEEPNRGTLEAFQDGQRAALAALQHPIAEQVKNGEGR